MFNIFNKLLAYKTIQETKAANKTQQQIEKEDNAAETNNLDEFDESVLDD